MAPLTIDPKLRLSRELAKYPLAERNHIMAVAAALDQSRGLLTTEPAQPLVQPKPKRTYTRKALGGGIPEGGPTPTE